MLAPHAVCAWCNKGLIRYLFALLITNSALHLRVHAVTITSAGADPGFDQGGAPDRDRPKLTMVHSSIVRVK